MNLSPLLLKDLPVPHSIIENMLNNPNCSNPTIDLTLFGNINVHVLPRYYKLYLNKN